MVSLVKKGFLRLVCRSDLVLSPKVIKIAESNSNNGNNVFLNDVEPVSHTSVQLTTLATVEDTVSDSQISRNVQDDPYPDKTPKSILEREYLVHTFTISSNSQEFVSPINLLLANPTIKAYLRNFRYLRCGFDLRIETITTPMQFGALGVSWLPYANSLRDVSLTAQSQSCMHVLDLCQQESMSIKLPYLRPPLYYDLEDITQQDWRVGFYGFVVDTITAGSPSTVVVNLFASMTDPEAAGYLPASGVFQSKMGPSSFTGDAGFTTAGVMAASMYVMGGGVEFNLPTDNMEVPSENAKLSLLGDIATPEIRNSTTCTRLGDSTRPKKLRSRTAMDIYSLGEIAQVPVHTETFALSKIAPQVIQLTPFPTMSHASYIKEMFKYFRGGSKILLKFLGSPMMSARVVINLYTTGTLKSPSDSIGDVMSWVLSVKGSQDWCIEVPYLQKRSWLSTDLQGYVTPILTVSLLESLPQPYDKTVSLYCIAFQSAAEDLCFAGLESFVPRTEEVGQFQSVSGSMKQSVKLGSSSVHPYQGRSMNVSQIVGRFGSRTGGPENLFPFPLEITSWTQGYGLDNFDYISQLYAFYTGDTHIKMLFSAAPAGGTLNVVFGNSKTSTVGDKFKAGNSMVVSHQSVWPAVEFVYPYMCEDEFNSIRYPVGMYPQDYDWSATVSDYLIAATSDFSLHYLMPVPEFFRSARPTVSVPPEGVFQSRYVGAKNLTFRFDTAAGVANPAPILADTNTAFNTGVFTLDLQVTMLRLTGADDTSSFLGLRSDNTPFVLPNGVGVSSSFQYMAVPLTWADQNNSGRYVCKASASQTYSNMGLSNNLYLGYVTGSSASTWRITGVLRITPWKHASILLNPTDLTLYGYVNALTTTATTSNVNVVNVPSVTISGPSPLPVNITGATSMIPVEVVSSSNLNVNVLGGSIQATIDNTASEPVPVTWDSSLEVGARVQGVTDPDQPVWVTGYK